MDATAVASSAGILPSSSSWYMNPFFLASFGAFAAIGFVMAVTAYIIFGRLRATPLATDVERCSTCGMTVEMATKLLPCNAHSGLVSRLDAIERWIPSHEKDYRDIRSRVDEIERGGRNARRRDDP